MPCYLLATEPNDQVPRDPCAPSPCGSFSYCRNIGGSPACTCREGYVGQPPNCRPECSINSECPSNEACINEKCRDPCLGSCGFNAMCSVSNHIPICTCPEGFTGDPFTTCNVQPVNQPIEPLDKCNPSPCGSNAQCNDGQCTCLPEFQGNPYTGCRPECVLNTDCPRDRACWRNKCRDPCPGTCATNANCAVINHVPMCSCPPGMTGNAFSQCLPIQATVPANPCSPSPCGQNSECRVINGQAVCSCIRGYLGSPPTCRPECIVSTDCPPNEACFNQKCQDPCQGTCGVGATCQVINHNPICSCLPRFSGDPFVRCTPIPEDPPVPQNPCQPSPCGPNAQCQVINNSPSCSCLAEFTGSPPNCRPECVSNSECSSNLACINQKCKNPCIGSCGADSDCHVVSHTPMCVCRTGFTGDPFTQCILQQTPPSTAPETPCTPSPCGPNAVCKEQNGAGSCSCLPEYTGNPYEGCRPECIVNSDCASNMACIRSKCRDPCPGTCGMNAECRVMYHLPQCSCFQGYTGDPFSYCSVLQDEQPPTDPCSPSPCGPNSQCRVINTQPVCTCLPEYIGSPPGCRPECTVSSECPTNRACVNRKCSDPCPGTCGFNTRCEIINHSPICSCQAGYTGDPFVNCFEMMTPMAMPTQPTYVNPCVPSPCGPNSECRDINSQASCACLSGFNGSPPNCRPECVINPDCSSNQACLQTKCRDPCPGSCGVSAVCSVVNHTPVCTCPEGFSGDPFTRCSPRPSAPPEPVPSPCSRCGSNTQCINNQCMCLPEFQGDPYAGCRPECVLNPDCRRDQACIRNKCRDPCVGICGQNALCSVVNHVPVCTCPPQMSGNAFVSCSPVQAPQETDPCNPSPCGSNSQCRKINNQAVCSCISGYLGAPPNCRPECVISSDCTANMACSNQKCIDPCPGTCGIRAQCNVVNHNPICSCLADLTGDPFVMCVPIPQEPEAPKNPCQPSPCGPNAFCQVINNSPSCSCLPEFSGIPPNCRPECVSNGECSTNLACINQKCRDPCPGSCGANAECRVISHTPMCVCMAGFTGDPFTQCAIKQMDPIPDVQATPCIPSPCGSNAICREQNGAGACSCLPDYIGNPYEGCRPECIVNSDCTADRTCIRSKCQNPCPGTCGQNAICQVVDHRPSCTCQPGYSGDPFRFCSVVQDPPVPELTRPCSPSPCGPNSQCRENNGQAICSCSPTFVGTPPYCRPECSVSSECALNRACINNKCVDPCPGICGVNAKCNVINHSPFCSCNAGLTGDPFVRCFEAPVAPESKPSSNPCVPSPCGPFSMCRDVGGVPSCSCEASYIGSPPNCRPECTINSECVSNLACLRYKCTDPCPGSCGINAQCSVINHTPICTCPEGFTGDPFTSCTFKQPVQDTVVTNPCDPSPCGANTRCRDGVCTCLPEYHGDPYYGCRPECVQNPDCPSNKACIRNKCADPCPGVCGANAECNVVQHIPMCSCPAGTTGNAFANCITAIEPTTTNPCDPSPCGPNSRCQQTNGQAVCSCVMGFIGHPPACRPECVSNSECPLNEACVNQKCRDPCPGSCGVSARCQVVNHNPICSCPSSFTGDPFIRCIPVQERPPETQNPCQPSPCGANAQCQVINDSPSCSCLPEFLGAPPNCRPECASNGECASHLACINRKCQDPCRGSCGQNAECFVINHTPTCSCMNGFTGDPFAQCNVMPPQQIEPSRNPCVPSPCGSNAVCREQNGAGACSCIQDYIGNPYQGCRPECTINTDCPANLACIRSKCQDPCPGTCGQNANCQVVSHLPSCTCNPGFTGNPFSYCNQLPPEIGPSNDDPCSPSPCGPNSRCQTNNGQAMCSCEAQFIGSPPNCRPECTISTECAASLACINQKCRDPCAGTCGINAQCRVINHSPICSCQPGTTGDPFFQCFQMTVSDTQPTDPCNPSPCGPNSLCRVIGDSPSCACLNNFIGSPPNCRPECSINPDCTSDKACMREKCRDPCPGSCGLSAHCSVVNHTPVCTCPEGFTGDPFTRCSPAPPPAPAVPEDPCNPSPCGSNAQCRNGQCSCLPEYQGDPYVGCRPECVVNEDCSRSQACINQKCRDPCAGVCGVNAECNVVNHLPMCSCPVRMSGNAFIQCSAIEDTPTQDPCYPSPCGPNSHCQTVNNLAVCTCVPGFLGTPPSCRPECVVSADCPRNRACNNQKCIDPCPGTCGLGAECLVINHNPVCSCPNGFTGDPFVRCSQTPKDPQPSVDPCQPSPCGPNAQCRVINNSPSCSCNQEFIGSPPNCRPECISNSECSSHLACINQKCKDPCPGSCGSNTNCATVSHTPMCSCVPGFTGDPFSQCNSIPGKFPK